MAGNVVTFEKGKKSSERNKVVGIRPVDVVLMAYADNRGVVDERICLVLDENSVLSFPKTRLEPLNDEARQQLITKLKLLSGSKRKMSGLPILTIAPVKKVEETSSVED